VKQRHNRSAKGRRPGKKLRWSAQVTKTSNALELEPSVFKLNNPRRIAQSLKRSAVASKRRKASPYQSAMSMLNFYINRAGKNLPQRQNNVLERAKKELRSLFKHD
jgi:putative cell wall-binding protein